jgi:hypothetical protein
MIYTPYQILFRYKIKENEMGKACDLYEREQRCVECFGRKIYGKETGFRLYCSFGARVLQIVAERDHFEDTGLYGG